MNKKLIVGLAAGVAAAGVIGVLYRKGTLQPLMTKIDDLCDALSDKFKSDCHPSAPNYIPSGEQKNVSKSIK
ncbi:MAG: hypothetical protein IR153_01350 [Flavobacterium sp.]|nr:hypothetical protein [Flavobacterium sp.]